MWPHALINLWYGCFGSCFVFNITLTVRWKREREIERNRKGEIEILWWAYLFKYLYKPGHTALVLLLGGCRPYVKRPVTCRVAITRPPSRRLLEFENFWNNSLNICMILCFRDVTWSRSNIIVPKQAMFISNYNMWFYRVAVGWIQVTCYDFHYHSIDLI